MAISTVWLLALGAAAVMLGTDDLGGGNGMAMDGKDPSEVVAKTGQSAPEVQKSLAEALRRSGTDPSTCQIQRVGLRFPGWSFFLASCEAPDLAMDHGLPNRPLVVREDGSVVEGPPEPEIARFLASLGLPGAEPTEPLHRVARAVMFLAGAPGSALKAEDASQWLAARKGADLAGPTLATKGGSATLTFWAQGDAIGRTPPTFTRFEVRLDAKGRAKLARRTVKTTTR